MHVFCGVIMDARLQGAGQAGRWDTGIVLAMTRAAALGLALLQENDDGVVLTSGKVPLEKTL